MERGDMAKARSILRDVIYRLSNHKVPQYSVGETIDILEDIVRKLTRSPKIRVAPTKEFAEQLRQFAYANPDLSQQEIAIHFKCGNSRVSEALNYRGWAS